MAATNIQGMRLTNLNTQSGSYERTGTGNREDAFLIGDVIETSLFPTNTLESSLSVVWGS